MTSWHERALRVLSLFCICALLGATAMPSVAGAIRLDPVLQGLSSPLYVTNAHDGTNRLFVVEQAGRVKVLLPGASSPTVFLDITSKVLSGGERGLLGLAFHPQFGNGRNTRFFVNYTRQPDGATVISEYRVSADPDVAATSENVLLTIPQPYANNSGGMIEFGFDGYLYIGVGDGGSRNDSQNHAQHIDDLLGRILRIDVDHLAGQKLYSTQPGNPYAGVAGSDETFAAGMRNPFRFSFDRQTGQLYVGHAAQGALEEVDIVTAGGNYARVDEGTQCASLDSTRCALSNHVAPIAQYSHSGGRCSITGGYVYRGPAGALSAGTYVFGDYCTGEIFSLPPGGSASVLLDTTLNISSFGEDEAGEIHVVGLGGTVHRIASIAGSPASASAALAQVITAAAVGSNVALAGAGGVATASSTASPGYPASAVNNNERAGARWGNGGGWADGTPGTFPDWVQIAFNGSKTIDRVVVYTLQDNYKQPVEPTDATAFATYGITAFTVERWTGTNWSTLATVSGNTLVKRTVTFAPTATERIRINVTAARGAGVYITEIEAWTPTGAGGPTPTTTTLSSSGSPAAAGASVSFTASVSGTNPTGTVGFRSDGNAIGGCTAVALTGSGNSKSAVCTTNGLAVGTHSIVASYAGDANNAASTSAALAQAITAVGVGSNVALAGAGGVATASSTASPGYPASAVNNNERAGAGWGNGGGWADGTPGTFPDSVQIAFNGSKTIDRVVVYTLQDNYTQPVEPTDATTFATYGITAFTVERWTGTNWSTLATVSGNTLVKRTVTFAPTATERIRINVTAARGAGVYITEIEAWTPTGAGGPTPTTTTLSSSGSPAAAGASVSFTASVSGTNPTGTVGFRSDGNAIGGCTAVALTGSGNSKSAVCTTNGLAVGTHSIVASYAGDANNAASTSAALAQVTIGPGPAPAPIVVRMTDAPTFPGDYDGPTWELANRPIFAPWVHPGGDWRDSADIAQGNAYFATSADVGAMGDVALPVTALVARLLANNTGIYLTTTRGLVKLASRSHATLPGPRLHVVTTTGTFDPPCIVDTWLSASTNLPLGDQQTLEFPAILKFDLSGVTGTVTQATLTLRVSNVYVVPAAFAVNYLDPPTLNLTATGSVVGSRAQGIAATVAQDRALASHPSVLLYDDLVSKDYIRANFQGIGGPGSAPPNLTDHAQIIQWPQFGLSAARVWSITTNQRLISWHHWAEPKQNPPKPWQRDFGDGHTHLFFRYLMEIGTDVKAGMTELGMKLPGMAGTYDFSNSGAVTLPQPRNDGTWEMRLWHSGVSPRAHPDIYHLATYYYGVEHPLSLFSGVGDARYTAGFLKAGRVYSIEQEVKLNTITNGAANADGIERVWLDGVLIYENTSTRIRGYDNVRIQSIPWANIYHGGLGMPAAPFHYDIGGFAVATEYIGPPKVVQ